MKTGSLGTFVISWSQTEVDGLKAASLDLLTVGAAWRWTGAAVRVDGPQGLLLLERAEGAADLRKRAARMVRRLVGAAVGARRPRILGWMIHRPICRIRALSSPMATIRSLSPSFLCPIPARNY